MIEEVVDEAVMIKKTSGIIRVGGVAGIDAMPADVEGMSPLV